MVRASLPPGFRFHPTDDELVTYYLKRKVMGRPFRSEAISEVDLYKFGPWDLPGKASLQSKDLEWFFFCALDKKYANGRRANRANDNGYWKTTGKDRPVYHNSRIVGMKRTLVFHIGRAPRGDRTNWVMHEYRLEDQRLADADVMQDAFVLCKIFQKSGPGPKNGEQRGAPFQEEDWEDDAENNSSLLLPLVGPSSPTSGLANISATNCTFVAHLKSGDLLHPHPQSYPVASEEDPSMHGCIDVDELLASLSDDEDDALASNEDCFGEKPESAVPSKAGADEKADPFKHDDIFNDLVDIVSPSELCLQGSYLELDDLKFPLDDDGSEFGTYDSTAPLNTPNIPKRVMDGPNDNVANQAGPHNLDAPAVQIMSEVANNSVPQTLLAGEQHKLPLPSAHVSNGWVLFSELQHLLASIPAKSASAAEFPSHVGGNQFKGSNPCCQSPCHVKAEMADANLCSVDVTGVDGKLGHATCMVCYGGKPSRKCGGHSSLPGGGFTFVFLLGVVSAFMWIFLIAMSAKLGRYAWKRFLAW